MADPLTSWFPRHVQLNTHMDIRNKVPLPPPKPATPQGSVPQRSTVAQKPWHHLFWSLHNQHQHLSTSFTKHPISWSTYFCGPCLLSDLSNCLHFLDHMKKLQACSTHPTAQAAFLIIFSSNTWSCYCLLEKFLKHFHFSLDEIQVCYCHISLYLSRLLAYYLSMVFIQVSYDH